MKRLFIAAYFSILFPVLGLAQLSGTLNYGKYLVGFKVIDTRDDSGNPFRLCIWYPAASKGSAIWPLILNDTEPVSLCVTNEFLASHGFIVAQPATQYPLPGDDKTLYQGPSEGLITLLNHMLDQSNIDKDQVFAFGFGGGAMASFYTAMRTGKIRRFVNVEGGLFMPESKTTLSSDYSPASFNSTLLHIINPYILSKENSEEFNAIKSPKFRMMEKVRLQHHDFTICGRIISGLLQMRGIGVKDATAAHTELHQHIGWFFKEGKLNPELFTASQYFKLETF